MQKARDLDAAEIRRRCAEFAEGFIDIQRTSLRRQGVFGDWEHPYLTMKPAYEANILRVFAKLVEDGAVYQSRQARPSGPTGPIPRWRKRKSTTRRRSAPPCSCASLCWTIPWT